MAVVRGSMRRALSPEIQHSSPRARSPVGRANVDIRSAAVSTQRRVSVGADLGPGARVRSPEGLRDGRTTAPVGGAGRSSIMAVANSTNGPAGGPAGDRVVEEIRKIGANREQRRRHAEETRRSRQEEAQILESQNCGRAADVEFHRMIRDFREQMPEGFPPPPVEPPSAGQGCIVCVRKRPVQPRETSASELDCVTANHPRCVVHERKFKVDGITKYLDSQSFEFDRVFGESSTTEQVYTTMGKPLVPWVLSNGGRVTLFAYGQTGSGKTYTCVGLQRLLSEDLFEQLGKVRSDDNLRVYVSFFEIYGGQPYDLLNNRQRLEVLEDARSEVQVSGLAEREVLSASAMLQCIEMGSALRTTHATSMNEYSSRSHAIISVSIRENSGAPRGRITLVDLAGSERAGESKSSVRQRRVEGAQINRSLLALKECIRAMSNAAQTGAHVPYRASKLTLVLRDAFNAKGPALTVMIACVSPGMSDANHSINTLRYSARLKDRPHTPEKGEAVSSGTRAGRAGGASRQRSPSATGESRIAGSASFTQQHPAIRAHQQAVNDDQQPSRSRGRPQSQSPPRTREQPRGCADEPRPVADLSTSQPVNAWQEQQVEALAGVKTQLDEDKAHRSGNSRHENRRGRQPTLRDPQKSRFERAERVDAPAPGKLAKDDSIPAVPATAPIVPSAVPVARDRSGSDILGEDDRYLHSALTAEVQEVATRGGPGESPLDVGVEDLTDLAHLEALEEVRRLNDQVAAQHVAALQEDARLLSAESELLSRVHQDETYDIDRYVHELDEVVRRKLQVYGSLLSTLEILQSRLKHEESLTQHKSRHGVVALGYVDSNTARSPR